MLENGPRKISLLKLVTKGRKTGKNHMVELIQFSDGDRMIVIASKGGSPTHPDWYLNLVA
ncbi:MAG: nitroreductase/quinone reductase family protein, partial [Nitrososphaerales archaeon]